MICSRHLMNRIPPNKTRRRGDIQYSRRRRINDVDIGFAAISEQETADLSFAAAVGDALSYCFQYVTANQNPGYRYRRDSGRAAWEIGHSYEGRALCR